MWYYGGYPNYGVDFTHENAINDYNSVVSSEGEAHRAPTLTIYYTVSAIISDGIYYLRNLNSGMYLDIRNNATANGTPVQQYPFGDYPSERWQITYKGNGYYTLRAMLAPTMNKMLDGRANCVDGAQVIIYDYVDCPEQLWYFSEQIDGSYKLSPKRNLSLSLSVEGSSTASNANVKLATTSNSAAQKWTLEKAPLNKPYNPSYPYYGKGPRTGIEAENWYYNLLSTYDYRIRNEAEFVFNYSQLTSLGVKLSRISLMEYTLAERQSVMRDIVSLAWGAAAYIPYVGIAIGYLNDAETINNLGSASADLGILRAALDDMSHDDNGNPITNATYIVRFLQKDPLAGREIKITSSNFYKRIFTVSNSRFDAAKYSAAAYANDATVYRIAPQYTYYYEDL